jgi:monoamine oxidase
MPLGNVAIEGLLAVDAHEISLLFALFYIAAAGDAQNPGTFERLFNTRNGAQQTRFVGGSQQVPIRVARELGNSVVMGAPARRILQENGRVRVISDGIEAEGKLAIVAVPPVLAGEIDYEPGMPPKRDGLTKHSPRGSYVKVEAVYDRPFWRDDGLTGQAVCPEQTVCFTFDNSPPDGRPGILAGFVGGRHARHWTRRSKTAFRQEVLQQFADVFEDDRFLQPREYFGKNWREEQWTRGCPTAFGPPGFLTTYRNARNAPVGRIHWAGTETAGYWTGYMDGAVRAGERAAREVLAEL